MPDWIHNPHAGYALAAYAIAVVVLAGLALASWRDYKSRAREWRKLSNDP